MKKRSKKKIKKRHEDVGTEAKKQSTPDLDDLKKSGDHNAVPEPFMEQTDSEIATVSDDGDEISLSRAKTYWFFGEWHKLVSLDLDSFCKKSDRDRFALLVASANQQLGNDEEARKCTRKALEWGCEKQVVAQVLIAGVHNTLGRAAVLQGDDCRTADHFKASIAAIGAKDYELLGHARTVKEMVQLGLLPQAASIVDKQIKISHDNYQTQHQLEAHYKVLQTEIELLSGELSLALQKGQLAPDDVSVGDRLLEDDASNSNMIEELKKKSVSQLGQDLWVLEQTDYKRDGFFVEFGATDGVLLSNTWLLEKELGWRGICIEPNPKFYKKLQRNRKCMLFKECIGAITGEKVEFVFADVFGGMTKHIGDDSHADKRASYQDIGETEVLETISLHDFLKRSGAPLDIDYMSIDTEGSEYEILDSFPFDQWNVRLLTVEHNFTDRRHDIRVLLESHGYRCVESQWDDWFYKE